MTGPWEEYGPWSAFGGGASAEPKARPIRSMGADRKADIARSGTKPKPVVAARGAKRSLLDEVSGALANFNRGAIVGDEVSAALATGVDALTGNVQPSVKAGENPFGVVSTLRALGNRYQERLGGHRYQEDDFASRRPLAAGGARTTGAAATLAIPGGAAVQAPTRLAGAAQAGTIGATQGYLAGLGDRGSLEERLDKAQQGGLIGGVVGAGLGGALTRGRPRPLKIDPKVEKLAREGVEMTPGQIRGGLAKSIEDKATSLPVLGEAITEARRRGMASFTRAPVQRGLNQIDETLPEGMTGNEAVDFMRQRFDEGYDAAKPAGGVVFDSQFGDELTASTQGILSTLTPKSLERLRKIVDQRLTSRAQGGALPGDAYKQIQSELRYEADRFSPSGDADERAIGQALSGVQDALKTAAARQNPEFARRLSDLDRGYAEYARVREAAGRTGAEEGVFTPAMYDAAVRKADRSVGYGRYAGGKAYGQDLADAGRAVLPSRIADSGTGGRLLQTAFPTTAATIGATAGASIGGPAGGAIGGALGVGAGYGGLALASRAYSPRAITLANDALRARLSQQDAASIIQELELLTAAQPANAPLLEAVRMRLGVNQGAGAVAVQGATGGQPTPSSNP